MLPRALIAVPAPIPRISLVSALSPWEDERGSNSSNDDDDDDDNDNDNDRDDDDDDDDDNDNDNDDDDDGFSWHGVENMWNAVDHLGKGRRSG